MSTNIIKHPKHLEVLLFLIQKNDKKGAEGLINQYPLVLNEKCFDGLEPIFFCIRNKCNKLFKIMFEKMDLNDDLIKKIYSYIKGEGTEKMLKTFLDYSKIKYDESLLEEKDREMLSKNDNEIKMNIE